MAQATSKKVGNKVAKQDETANAETKKEKVKRPAFDVTKAVDSKGAVIPLDENERLTGIPVNWINEYSPLKSSAFAKKETFFEWKAAVVSEQMERLSDRREELLERAEEARKGVDPVVKKQRKLAKMTKEMEKLREELKAQGINPDEL